MNQDFPYEEISSIQLTNGTWLLMVSSTNCGGEARVMLYALDNIDVSLPFKLTFPYSNKEAQHEALTITLGSVCKEIQSIYQASERTFTFKEFNLASYRTTIAKLIRSFSSIRYKHVS